MADLEVNSIVFDPNGGDEGNPVFSQGELFFSGNVFHYVDISNVHEPIATHTVVNSSIAQASGELYNSGQTLIAYSNAVQSNLNTETKNRRNADITLQSNINTLSGLMITATSVSTLTNKTITGLSNKVETAALLTATGSVDVSGSVAPTSGQVLIANSATNATWQTQIQTLNGLSAQSQTFAVGTAGTTFNVSSTGSTHTFNIPNASTTSSGLVTVGAQTFAGVKTFQDNSLQVQNPAHTFAYTLSGSAITADRNLILPVISQDEFVAIRPAILQSSPVNPTGTTSTAGVMMGLAGALTPRVTGRVKIVINGYMSESAAARGVTAQIRYGTGTAPVNGAALTGTTAGGNINMFQTAATQLFPFSCNAIVSGLTLGTAIWIDLAVARVGASGTGSVLNISITAFEL